MKMATTGRLLEDVFDEDALPLGGSGNQRKWNQSEESIRSAPTQEVVAPTQEVVVSIAENKQRQAAKEMHGVNSPEKPGAVIRFDALLPSGEQEQHHYAPSSFATGKFAIVVNDEVSCMPSLSISYAGSVLSCPCTDSM